MVYILQKIIKQFHLPQTCKLTKDERSCPMTRETFEEFSEENVNSLFVLQGLSSSNDASSQNTSGFWAKCSPQQYRKTSTPQDFEIEFCHWRLSQAQNYLAYN